MHNRTNLILLLQVLLSFFFFPDDSAAALKWVNKDLKNTLPNNQNAGDVDVYFTGHIASQISAYFDDTTPPVTHQLPTETTITTPNGFNLKVTIVKWVGNIPNGDTVHVGVLVDEMSPGRFYQAYWTDGSGAIIDKVAGCSDADFVFDGTLQSADVHIQSPVDSPPVVVTDFSYAVSNTPFLLEDLTFDNPSIPWINIPGLETIQPGGDVVIDQITGVNSGQYIQLQMAVYYLGNQPSSAGHVIVQQQVLSGPIPGTGACCLNAGSCMENATLSECDSVDGLYQGDGSTCNAACGIPTVSEWGMIVLALLIVTGATILLRKRIPLEYD